MNFTEKGKKDELKVSRNGDDWGNLSNDDKKVGQIFIETEFLNKNSHCEDEIPQ